MLLLAVLISVPSILKLTFEAAVGMFTVTTYCISRTFQVFANLFSFCVGMNANHQFDLWLLWLLLYNWSLHSLFFYVYVTASQCLDFGLPGVLGIAFGGFLIGVLLIGALWFIKIKTGKCTTNNMVLNIDLNWSLSGFEMFTFCLIQGTQLDWTLAQLQQIFLVRIFSFRFVSFLFVFFLFFLLLASFSSFFRMSLLRSKTTACFYQPFPLWEQQRQRQHWKHPKHTDQQHGMRLW